MQKDQIVKTEKGETKMSHPIIDVHDLPEEEVRIVREFVAFLKKQIETKQVAKETERGWPALSVPAFAADWENPQDALYDNWKEHYHVSER